MLNKTIKNALGIAVTSVALMGCGKAVGHLPFSGEGARSVALPLAAGDVAFWTDLDLKYEGDAALVYRIDLLQSGRSVATAVCDPLGQMNVKMGWVETNLGSSHSRSGFGKMACSASLPAAGSTIVQATLAFDSRPATFTLKTADLVLKQ